MKKLIMVPLSGLMCVGAYAQGLSGYVTFANGTPSKVTAVDNNNVTSTPGVSSGGWQIELFYQADPNGSTAPTAITSSGVLGNWQSAAIIQFDSKHPPGIFAGGTTTLPGIVGGANAWLDVVVFNNGATSLANALGGVSTEFGSSSVFSLGTGDPNTQPPGNPPLLSTAPGFTGVVATPITATPEPTTLALGALGAASLLAFRRKK